MSDKTTSSFGLVQGHLQVYWLKDLTPWGLSHTADKAQRNPPLLFNIHLDKEEVVIGEEYGAEITKDSPESSRVCTTIECSTYVVYTCTSTRNSSVSTL